MNHVLKEATENEEMSLPEFIALSKAVAESQRLDVVRAFVRKGKYRLKKDFSFLVVSELKWMHEMDRSQRDRHLQLVLRTELEAAYGPTAVSGISASTFPMSYGEAKLSHIPGTVLASIWNKVSEYLSIPNAVIQVPSEDECVIRYSVHSRSTQYPNSVTLTEDGKMTCTYLFKCSPNVCSHAHSGRRAESQRATNIPKMGHRYQH